MEEKLRCLMMKFDERDHMFSRMNLNEDWKEYKDYYKKRPDLKELDDEIRKMPEMGEEGSVTYNPINSPIVSANFRFLSDIKKLSEGTPVEIKQQVDSQTISDKLKELSRIYGANLVGICQMKEEYYYSNRGRDRESYGDEITDFHKYAIVFAVELQKDLIMRAPQIPEAIANVKGYTDVGIIGMILSYYIRELGYEARNHMDGNYLLIAPMVAVEAGLGEIGRNGLLTTKEYGPRVRLGVVTTNLELKADEKKKFGLQEFCERCGLCSMTCPGKAIPKGNKEKINGVARWKINMEECYKRWRSLGTDCGICLCNCPFSMGVDSDKVLAMQKDFSIMDKVIKEYKEKYGPRPILREKLEIEK